MSDLCSGCGKPPHAGGCRIAFSEPPPPSAEELQRRRDYLTSPEFLRERDASMAGVNPRPAADLVGDVRRAKARADVFQTNASLAWEKVEKAMVLLREKDEALAAANARADSAEGANTQLATLLRRSDAETLKAQEALDVARRECEALRNALGAAHDHAHAAGCRGYLGEDFFARIRAVLDGSASG